MVESHIPSELDFWITHVEALETCSICLEPFGGDHIALRFTGPGACSHVFGAPRLRAWTETATRNANKCPVCRRVLWRAEDPLDEVGVADDVVADVEAMIVDFEERQAYLEYLGRLGGGFAGVAASVAGSSFWGSSGEEGEDIEGGEDEVGDGEASEGPEESAEAQSDSDSLFSPSPSNPWFSLPAPWEIAP